MWQKVTGRVIRQGRKFWSTKDFNPGQEDIRLILSMASGLVHVCRSDKNTLIFRDNEFVGEGPYFPPQDIPQFATEKDAEYIYWMQHLGDFSVDELAAVRYPEVYMRGQAFRIIDRPNIWAPTKAALIDTYDLRSDEVEEYDYEKLARIRVGNFVYVKAKNEGWVVPTQYGKWRYIGRSKRGASKPR